MIIEMQNPEEFEYEEVPMSETDHLGDISTFDLYDDGDDEWDEDE